MLRILVTNDDGYRSEGIKALADVLAPFGDVTIVAPTTEASAIGHALTLRRPLRLEQIADKMYAVDGTPTDCVNIAVTQIFRGLPDLVVSGINKGWNLGDDVTYSGTVAGALEGALLGVAALAVSLRGATETTTSATPPPRPRLSPQAMLQDPLPARTFLNVNVPRGRPKGYRVTVQAKRNHITSVAERHDPKRQAVLLDRGRAGRLGAARPVGLPGRAGRVRVGDAAAPGSDRASGACGGRTPIFRGGS